jgi:hypothetical protein
VTQGVHPKSALHVPQWVGEEDSRRDVAGLSDRDIAAAALDVVLRLSSGLKRHSDEFREFKKEYEQDKVVLMRELADHSRRIAALEDGRRIDTLEDSRHIAALEDNRHAAALEGSRHSAALEERRPSTPPPYRVELQSSHDWNEMLAKAGEELSKRVKSPADRLTSERARAIASEVFEGAKVVEDATAFRAWKTRGRRIAQEIAKAIVTLGAGYLAARYGLHVGG